MFFGAPKAGIIPRNACYSEQKSPAESLASEILDKEKALPIVWWYTVLYRETYES